MIANARAPARRRGRRAALGERHLGAAAAHRGRRRRVPAALRGYLLDLKPGYEDDPTRALYNHVWLIGDPEAISVDFQAQVDEIAEVAPVTSGSGAESSPRPGDGRVLARRASAGDDASRDDEPR